jgi:hypothetical protein
MDFTTAWKVAESANCVATIIGIRNDGKHEKIVTLLLEQLPLVVGCNGVEVFEKKQVGHQLGFIESNAYSNYDVAYQHV